MQVACIILKYAGRNILQAEHSVILCEIVVFFLPKFLELYRTAAEM